jgi:hypothetical protein
VSIDSNDILPRTRPLGDTNGGSSPYRTTPQSGHRHRRIKRAESGCCRRDSRAHPLERSRGPNRFRLQIVSVVIVTIVVMVLVFIWRSKSASQSFVLHRNAPNASLASLLKQLPREADRLHRPRIVESKVGPKSDSTLSVVLRKVLPSSRPFVRPSDGLPIIIGHDFGELDIRILEDKSSRQQRRQVLHDFHEDLGYSELLNEADDDEEVESYYAFDDDEKRSPYVAWDDPDIHERKKCRRTSWHRDLPINCNVLHELDVLDRMRTGEIRYLG